MAAKNKPAGKAATKKAAPAKKPAPLSRTTIRKGDYVVIRGESTKVYLVERVEGRRNSCNSRPVRSAKLRSLDSSDRCHVAVSRLRRVRKPRKPKAEAMTIVPTWERASSGRNEAFDLGATAGHAPFKFEVGHRVRINGLHPKLDGQVVTVMARCNDIVGEGNIYACTPPEMNAQTQRELCDRQYYRICFLNLPERMLEPAPSETLEETEVATSDWIEHDGKPCRLPIGTEVEFQSRDGQVLECTISNAEQRDGSCWHHDGNCPYWDVMRYRIIKPAEVPHEVKVVAAAIGEPAEKVAADLESTEAAAGLPNSRDKAPPMPGVKPPKPWPRTREDVLEHTHTGTEGPTTGAATILDPCAPNGSTVWIVGRQHSGTWDFQGVFLSEQEAADLCADASWFVAPAVVGEALPAETVGWPGIYWPRASEVTFKPGDRVMVTGPALEHECYTREDYPLTGMEGVVESIHESGVTVFVRLDDALQPVIGLLAHQLMLVADGTAARAAHMTAAHGYDKDAGLPADDEGHGAFHPVVWLAAVTALAVLLYVVVGMYRAHQAISAPVQPANMPASMAEVAAILSDCERRTNGPCALTAVAQLAYEGSKK